MNTRKLNIYISSLGLTDDWKTAKEISSFFSRKENMRGDIKLALAQLKERIGVNIRFRELNK